MALPLTANVVTERLKRGGEFDGKRVIEVENYYVRSARGDRWQACRHAQIDVPVHVTGEVAMVWPLPGTPARTPQDAARRMWSFVRQSAALEGTWLVDDDLPPALRAGVNLMPLERALAIYDAIALTRTPTIDARVFLENYAHVTAGTPKNLRSLRAAHAGGRGRQAEAPRRARRAARSDGSGSPCWSEGAR